MPTGNVARHCFSYGICLVMLSLFLPLTRNALPLAAAEPANDDEAAVRPVTLPAALAGPDTVPDATEPPFLPVQNRLPVAAPPGAIVLLSARPQAGAESELPQFVNMSGGPIDWPVREGSIQVQVTPGHANHILSTAVFRDADIHAEFMTTPQGQGNSGLYLHGHYELQIYDSFGVNPPTEQDEGSLYRFGKPLVNAARPTGQWQVYDIRFRAPRRDAKGHVEKVGSITAWLNGQKVQDNIEFQEPRSPYIPFKHGVNDYLRGIEKRLKETGFGPLFLQDHGSPVRFRNIWIVPRTDS